jgi:hypothetical protein
MAQYVYFDDGVTYIRKGARSYAFVVDMALTPLAFAGIQDIDWVNVKEIPGPSIVNVPVRGVTISHKSPARISSRELVPYVTFSVNPGLGGCYEFLDMFISASYKPDSVEVAMDKDFTDSAIISSSKIVLYNDGLFYIKRLPRTGIGNKVLIGKVLFVKIIFPSDQLHFYDLKIVKTGYKDVN